ncbi:MAG: hypothetical protein GC165_04170 [Armatimonadetes bacterium]|nr:hypothetical protein [Armatimonadota bacterium]
MLRREVFAVWILLSTPIVGFVAYLLIALGLHLGPGQTPLFGAMAVAVVSLFFLSWTFLSHSDWDWRASARFMAVAFIFEGIVLALTRNSGGTGSLYFGVGTMIAGIIMLLGSRKH